MYSLHYKKQDVFGLLSIALFIFYYTLHALNGFYMKAILGLALLMGLIHIVKIKKIQKKTLLFMLCIALIFVVRLAESTDIRMLILFIVAFIGIDIDIDDIISWMFISKLLAVVVVAALRLYTGNSFSLHAGMLILLYLCDNRKRLRLRHILIAFCSGVLLYLYTDTGALIVAIFIAVSLLFYNNVLKGEKIFSWKVIEYVFPIALIANVICVLTFVEKKIPYIGDWLPESVNELFYKMVELVDIVTSSRITLAAASWPVFGVSMWGGNIDYSLLNIGEGVYYYLDSGMMWLLQGWGIIITIIFMCLCVRMMNYFLKNKEYVLLTMGVVLAFWGINEDMLIGIDTNFLIVFFGKALAMKMENKG